MLFLIFKAIILKLFHAILYKILLERNFQVSIYISIYTKLYSTFVIYFFLSILNIYFSNVFYFIKETSKDFEANLLKNILF